MVDHSDWLRYLDDMFGSSSEDEFGPPENVENAGRRQYRMRRRTTVDDYDDVDFRLYYRMDKPTFWVIHGLVREKLDGDRRR